MTRKTIIALILCSIILFGFALTASAGNDAEAMVMIDDEELEAEVPFTDAKGRSLEEVERVMDYQKKYILAYGAFEEKHKSELYPESYAGVYFSDDYTFVVKSVSQDNAAIAELQEIFGKDIVVKPAQYSMNEMVALKEAAKKSFNSEEAYAKIDPIGNVVKIVVTEKFVQERGAAALSELASLPMKILGKNIYIGQNSIMKLDIVADFDKPEKTTVRNINQAAYYSQSSSHGCWATRNGVNGIVFAGHSTTGQTGSTVKTSSSGSTIGTVQVNSFRNNSYADAGWIQVTGNFQPNVSGSTFLPIMIEPYVSWATLGATVRRKGKTTDSSGVITDIGIPIRDPNNNWITKDMVCATYTTTMGESGGAVIGSDVIYGIQSAGTGPSYFSQWHNIRSELGVDVIFTR